MSLNPPLFLAGVALVAATGSAVFLAEWRRNRAADSLLWWSVCLALVCASFLLLIAGGDAADSVPRMLGNYVALGAAGTALSATRRLHGLSPNLLGLVIGPTIWLGVSAKLGTDFTGRVIVIGTLQALYALATAFEMMRGGWNRAAEFRIATAMMAVIAVLHTVRVVAGRAIAGAPVDPGLHGQWVAPTATVAAVYAAGLAILVVRGFRKAGQTPGPERAETAPATSRSRVVP